MLIESALILQILGVPLPASTIRVPVVPDASYHSVHFFDNQLNVTNRVLDRSIRADVVRVHTNPQTGEVKEKMAKVNQQMIEEHCKVRLNADGISNATMECGSGKLHN